MPSKLLAWFAILGWSVTAACAQEDKPRLILNTGGPVGHVWSLAFSPDSRQLFAGGAGKIVHSWIADPQQGFRRATPSMSFPWEISRGDRGLIYSLDIAGGDAPVLAIAGHSARGLGDIHLVKIADGTHVAVLPAKRPDAIQPGPQTGHIRAVRSVAFSPAGTRLISASTDGDVRVWQGPNWASVPLRAPDSASRDATLPIAFLDERRFLVPTPVQNRPGVWQLTVFDAADAGARRALPSGLHNADVVAIAVERTGGRVVSADRDGTVMLWDGRTLQRTAILPGERDQNNRPTSAFRCGTWIAPDRLAIVRLDLARSQFVLDVRQVEQEGQALRQIQALDLGPSGRGDSLAIACSPDRRCLAVGSPDSDEIRVYSLTTPDGRPRESGVDPAECTRLAGVGRKIRRVQFAAQQPLRLRIESDRVDGFDLSQNRLIDAADLPAWLPAHGGDEWNATIRAEGSEEATQIGFAPAGQPARCVATIPQHLGQYADHAWLRDAAGRIDAVAIATTDSHILVFGLPAAGPCPLWRYYRDHSAVVTSLTVSPDQKYLASGSWDQTVKLWSLAGLRDRPAQFPRRAAWGANFVNRGNVVTIEASLGAGIVSHRELLDGDQVTQVDFARQGGTRSERDPAAILRVLNDIPLYDGTVLHTTRNGEARPPLFVTPAWEPVLTLFLSENGEWAIWTPQGPYDCSASGDELFGWIVNRGREQVPLFHRAEQFRPDLERPELIRRVLESGSLRDAQAALQQAAAPTLQSLAARLPEIQILAPANNARVPEGQTVRIIVDVQVPEGATLDQFIIEAFANQFRITPEPRRTLVRPNVTRLEWDTAIPDPKTQILIRARARAHASGFARFVDRRTTVLTEAPPRPLRLHLLAVTGQTFPSDSPFPSLRFPGSDGASLSQTLQSSQGRQYDLGVFRTLSEASRDRVTTRADLKRGITRFMEDCGTVNERDFIVVFVAGHGIADEKGYHFIPPDPAWAGRSAAAVAELGVPWSDFLVMADLPCRKLFIMDTCYSGNIAAAEKAAIRPLKSSMSIVFAATSVDQFATELQYSDDLPNALFTGSLLAGLGGKADGVSGDGVKTPSRPDGRVDLHEWITFVTRDVFRRFPLQRPSYTPLELLQFCETPLVELSVAKPASSRP